MVDSPSKHTEHEHWLNVVLTVQRSQRSVVQYFDGVIMDIITIVVFSSPDLHDS